MELIKYVLENNNKSSITLKLIKDNADITLEDWDINEFERILFKFKSDSIWEKNQIKVRDICMCVDNYNVIISDYSDKALELSIVELFELVINIMDELKICDERYKKIKRYKQEFMEKYKKSLKAKYQLVIKTNNIYIKKKIDLIRNIDNIYQIKNIKVNNQKFNDFIELSNFIDKINDDLISIDLELKKKYKNININIWDDDDKKTIIEVIVELNQILIFYPNLFKSIFLEIGDVIKKGSKIIDINNKSYLDSWMTMDIEENDNKEDYEVERVFYYRDLVKRFMKDE